MDNNSKNNFLHLSLLMFMVLLGIALFFLFKSPSPSSDFLVATIGLIVAVGVGGIGWYASKKFPQTSRTPLQILIFRVIPITLVVGIEVYQLAIERSYSNFFLFVLFFLALINSIQQYMKAKKTVSTPPNNKEIL